MKCEEALELITALVDDELPNAERAAIEGHLNDCPRCRFIHGQEQLVKAETRRAGSSLRVPAELREGILSDPRIFPERARSTEGWRQALDSLRLLLRPALVLPVALLFLLPALYLKQQTGPSVSATVLRTHEGIAAGTVAFARARGPEEVKEQLYSSTQGIFAPMGYDLSMIKLQPVGWAVREVRERKILVAVYQGEGPSLTCYTFIGTEQDAPDNATVYFDEEKKISFYAFSRGQVNAVLHREGNVICILVSKIPMRELIALARAKARPS